MREPGVVLRHEGGAVVVDVGGDEVCCTVRKTLRRAAEGKSVAVGDRVEVERDRDGAAVVGIEPRRNELLRPDPSRPRRPLVIVANLDLVLVVSAAAQPDPAPGLIDRFLVAANARRIAAAVAFHKIDLDPERAYRRYADAYRGLGYDVIETSAVSREGIDELRALLSGRTTTFVGHSGVGKSTLANTLDPALALRTGPVNADTGRGAHTTSTPALLRLAGGGYLVDTPGVREFGLWGLGPRDVGPHFPEISAHAAECRFRDCLHEREPGCAVTAALASGAILRWRYESYARILEGVRASEDGGG